MFRKFGTCSSTGRAPPPVPCYASRRRARLGTPAPELAAHAVEAAQLLDRLVTPTERRGGGVAQQQLGRRRRTSSRDRVDALGAGAVTELTTRSSPEPPNSSPTPSSNAQPPGIEPSRTAASQTGSRSGSPSAYAQRALEKTQPATSRAAARAGDAGLKPAHRARAEPEEHGVGPLRLDEQAVELVGVPQRQQTAHEPPPT